MGGAVAPRIWKRIVVPDAQRAEHGATTSSLVLNDYWIELPVGDPLADTSCTVIAETEDMTSCSELSVTRT